MPPTVNAPSWLAPVALVTLFACAPGDAPAPSSSPPLPLSATAVEPAVEVTTPEAALEPLPPEALPVLFDNDAADGSWAGLSQAVERNRRWLRGRPDSTVFVYGPRRVAIGELRAAFDRLAELLATGPTRERLAAQIAYDFDVLESATEVLVTGYYEPEIAASPTRTAEYDVPIYRPPDDLFRIDLSGFSDRFAGMKVTGLLRGNRLLPYPDRQELRESGRLRGRELAWARDRVDLFFLEIQGSGTLRFPDGRTLRIGYAGANGRPYRSIGRLLADEAEIERDKVSMPSIRAWLRDHPEEVDRVLDHNASVVFFRRLDGPPVGSLGVPVTPRRSIATDHRLFPHGALGFLESEVPALAADGTTVSAGPLTRFVVNQDTGGAIRGTGRVDFFWGRGEEAAMRAGVMKQPGRLYLLAPKVSGR